MHVIEQLVGEVAFSYKGMKDRDYINEKEKLLRFRAEQFCTN
jgi:hypothetical protein